MEYSPKQMAKLCELNARDAERGAAQLNEPSTTNKEPFVRLLLRLAEELDYAAERFEAIPEGYDAVMEKRAAE